MQRREVGIFEKLVPRGQHERSSVRDAAGREKVVRQPVPTLHRVTEPLLILHGGQVPAPAYGNVKRAIFPLRPLEQN